MGRLRAKLTYSNVVATLALFLALGGSSYAALNVGSKQIRNNGVRSIDLRNNDVRAKDIRNRTIRGADLARNALTSEQVADSSLLASDFMPGQLPKGETGATGPPGPTFAAAKGETPGAFNAVHLVKELDFNLPASARVMGFGDLDTVHADCEAVGGCTVTIELYVDGSPLPGGVRVLSVPNGAATTTYMQVSGLSASLPAGSHTLQLTREVSGAGGYDDSTTGALSIVAIGGS